MFLENKYAKVYFRLVARDRDIQGYTEEHHILPVSLGGANEPKSAETKERMRLAWVVRRAVKEQLCA